MVEWTFHEWYLHLCVLYSVAQSCPILWDPLDCSPPGISVRGRRGWPFPPPGDLPDSVIELMSRALAGAWEGTWGSR